MRQLLIFLTLFVGLPTKADEGLWAIHDFHPSTRGSSLCFYSENVPSIKDAIVAVGEGGSGSFISNTGLVLTNMHVIRSLVAKGSGMEHVMENGFCTSPTAPEFKLKGLYLKQLVRTVDVSAEVAQGLSEGQKWDSLVKEICLRYPPRQKGNTQEIKREFYGTSHFLHEYSVIDDVRLVFCPPRHMAFYGGDAVNWHWPRMSADFAILRAYVRNGDGESQPYSPGYYLKMCEHGVLPNEEVYVLGFPRGASNDWISADVDESILYSMVRRAEILALRIGVIKKYQGDVSSLDNERLKILGRITGAMRYMVPEKLLAREDSCSVLLRKQDVGKFQDFCRLRHQADSLVRLIGPLIEYDDDYRRCIQTIQFINSAGLVKNKNRFTTNVLSQLVDRVFGSSDIAMEKAMTRCMLNYLSRKHSIFVPKPIRNGEMGVNDYVEDVYSRSSLVQKDTVRSILSGSRQVHHDPAISYLEYTDSVYRSDVGTRLVSYASQLNGVRDRILAMLYDCGLIRWSGTNGTLRVSYGRTGVQCWATSLNREIGNAWSGYGYKLGDHLSDDKQVVMNFTTNCHTSGGNSGSPVINERGEMVGLNFDRVFDGLCGDYYYLPSVCRNICVSVDYIIQILLSRNDSKRILKEL